MAWRCSSRLTLPCRSATTHMDLAIRARERGIDVKVVHNASIMNACGACGLQLYSFGQTVSIPFFREEWRPDSFYSKIAYNKAGGMHTLALLDIKVKEPDFEAMVMGKKKYLPPRFMTVNTALEQLLEIEEKKGEGVITRDSMCIGLARVGQDTQKIISGTAAELLDVDFGPPLHSLVLCGEMHELEAAMVDSFSLARTAARASKAAERTGETAAADDEAGGAGGSAS